MDRPALPPSCSEILRSGHGVRCREAAFPGPARQWGTCPQGTLLPQDAAPVRPQSWWPRPWETTVPTGRTAFSFPPPARASTRTRYLTPKSHSALASTLAALNPPSGRAVAMGPPYLQVPRSKLHGKPGGDGPSCMSVTLCARRTNHQHLDPEAGPRPPRRQPPPPRWLPPLPRPLPAQATWTAPLFPSPRSRRHRRLERLRRTSLSDLVAAGRPNATSLPLRAGRRPLSTQGWARPPPRHLSGFFYNVGSSETAPRCEQPQVQGPPPCGVCHEAHAVSLPGQRPARSGSRSCLTAGRAMGTRATLRKE